MAEEPGLSATVIELSGGATPQAVEAAVAVAGQQKSGWHEVVIDRAGGTWRSGWTEVDLKSGMSSRPLGTVLVTGGLGGLGIRVAGMLRARLGVRAVLLDDIARAELAADSIAMLTRLAAAGDVEVLDADLADRAAVRSVLGGRIVNGIVHCAGEFRGGFVADATVSRLAAMQEPKVAGMHHVLAAVDRRAVRNLVTFGSIAARVPHRGMGSYALANELLRRATVAAAADLPECSCLAFEWSLFSGAGVAHRTGAVRQAKAMGMPPVPLRSGLDVLLWSFARSHTPADSLAVVGTGDLSFPARSRR
ncbi:KR domain-containing protein [Saccharopolyspora cebuensis]|uniref:KR domain-containing protein n=1 Tax=Saccharopolyspora cebuensis TaxID=418759 RepID=A0ABV4CSZ0_9PSEU